jgi:hypothetical protein
MSERSALIHIERLEGRDYPPASVDLDGTTNTLEGIYNDAGISVEINRGDTDIPDLKGPNSGYTQAELESLMVQYRKQPDQGEKMFAWLVVVTKFEGQDDILGIMFDAEERQGTAVFQGNDMIKTDPRAYMRTSAHELGHQFNLHHEDGTTYDENGITKYTIMNQTWRIQPWPAAIGYKFGEHESTHLSSHSIKNVQPGGGRFYDCDNEHATWHPGINVT